MNKSPKVSVCFLTFNSEKDNLKKSLIDLIKLDYQNIEFIISDDNSDDKSFQICKEITKRSNKRIILNKNKKNLGAWKNFYKAIKLSSGKYVFWACPDDFYQRNFISESINRLSLDTKFITCGTTIYRVNKSNAIIEKREFRGDLLPDKLSLFKLISLVLVKERKKSSLRPSYGTLIHSLVNRKKLLKVFDSYKISGPIINERVIISSLALMGEITYTTKTYINNRIHEQTYIQRKPNDPGIKLSSSKFFILKIILKFILSVINLPINFKRKLIIFPVVFRIIISHLKRLLLVFIVFLLKKILPRNFYGSLKKMYRKFYPKLDEYDKYMKKVNLKLKK